MDEYRESVQTYKDMLEHIFMLTAEISVTDKTLRILSFAQDSSKEGQLYFVSDADKYLDFFSEDEKRNFVDILNCESIKSIFADAEPKKICFSALSKKNICGKFVVSLYPQKLSGKIYMTVTDYDRSEHMITLMFKKNAVNIKVSDIYYVDYGNHSVDIHSIHGINNFFSVTFADVADILLKYHNFIRSYKNCIVNMDKISSVDGDSFIMENGDRISIPKRRLKEILQHYRDYKILE